MTLQQLCNAIDALERGRYCPYTIAQITDKITWLWKWRKISRLEMEVLSNKVIEILGGEAREYGVYYTVANRAFNTRAEAEKFCAECDFDFDLIQEVEEDA